MFKRLGNLQEQLCTNTFQDVPAHIVEEIIDTVQRELQTLRLEVPSPTAIRKRVRQYYNNRRTQILREGESEKRRCRRYDLKVNKQTSVSVTQMRDACTFRHVTE